MLPIDEDVDDEKCSPIKPKKRTSEDSPFKRKLAAIRRGDTAQNGNHESAPDGDSIEVRAFANADDDSISLDLNQVVIDA